MKAPQLTVVDCRMFERPYRLRMPFRFGVKTSTEGRQAVLRLRIRTSDGIEGEGYAAEALGAKWFDKDLSLTDDQNYHQLRRSLELASAAYQSTGPLTAFDLFAGHYEAHEQACAREKLNPLIASFGQSLMDRAVIDGLCRILDRSFFDVMAENLLGLRTHAVVDDLGDVALGAIFAAPVRPGTVHIRHTVGLADPLDASDLATEDRVNDGLPETLEEVISFYGNRYFKLKVSGDADADMARLGKIAAVLDHIDQPYFVTLDGNEQFTDAEAFAGFYRAVRANPALRRLAASVLYVEQPINRNRALDEPISALASLVPVIIDESDGALSAFPQARRLGYSGVSTKVCKGVYKSLINHARCIAWNEESGGNGFFISAEDLTCEPGIALHQDLALVSTLGLSHVEKNAHHFIDGFDQRPDAEARAFLTAHPDMYRSHGGRIRLHIDSGRLSVGSLACTGFGTGQSPLTEGMEPMPAAKWCV